VLCYIYIANLVKNNCVSCVYVLDISIKNVVMPTSRNGVERSKWMSTYFCVHTSNMLS
jgi:hypothetical protein